MKTHIALVLAAALLLVASLTLAEGGGPLPVAVEAGTVSGGAYQLISQGEAPGIEMAGGNYRLLGAVQPLLTGSGCCCTYLPCITKP